MFKKFSFPINLDFFDTIQLYNFLKRYKNLIKEIYFNKNILGFNDYSDMNGPIDNKNLSFSFLKKIQELNIKTTIIYNAINQPFTDFEFLDKYKYYIDNIVLYDLKVIPEIKKIKNFFIKNSVILLPTYEEIKAGKYDMVDEIYIHDEIIHNLDKFLELKKKKNLKFGTVINFENCSTVCAYKKKHYLEIKSCDFENFKNYCPIFKNANKFSLLNLNRIPFYKSEFIEYSKVLDTFKLQGRKFNKKVYEKLCLNIIKNFDKEIFDKDYFNLYKKLNKINKFEDWLNKIRNCGGDCYNCDYCENLAKEIDLKGIIYG